MIAPLFYTQPIWIVEQFVPQISGCPCNGSCAICRPPVDLRGAWIVDHPPLFGPPLETPNGDVFARVMLADALFGWLP